MSHPLLTPGWYDAWILTHTGKRFTPLAPQVEDICIEDIAHALSNTARFNGHANTFYSVAQHSVHVSHIVPREHSMTGLLHDAPEAYIADMVSPLKPYLTNYRDIEGNLWDAIAARFGLPSELPLEVKHADLVMLATERRDLMPPHRDEWIVLRGIEPLAMQINPFLPEAAKALFLQRWKELTE